MTLAPQSSAPAPTDPRFQAIFQGELSYVWGSLLRLGVARRDVEDVTHEVFLAVYKKLGAYDPARPLRPWLFGFAVRSASDYRRLARHRVEVMGHEADAPSEAPLADASLVGRERDLLVNQALETIPLERRAVLVGYEIDDHPMQDIADALGIPLHTGYSRLRVARTEFAAAILRLRVRGGEA